MKKSQPTRNVAASFVRIDTSVRDQLRAHCTERGLVMSTLVSNVLSEYLNHVNGSRKLVAEALPARHRKANPKRKSKSRR